MLYCVCINVRTNSIASNAWNNRCNIFPAYALIHKMNVNKSKTEINLI